MRSRGIGALGLLLAGGLLAAAASGDAAHAQQDDRAFTPAEQARLRAGELVTRSETRREGRHYLIGGTSWQRVRAPVEQVWETILDTNAYPRLIPALERAELVRDDDTTRVVHMQHRYSIARASYYAVVTIDAERHHLRFDLDRSRPADLRAGRGFISLSPYRGDTIVSWGVLADPGGGVVTEVFGSLLHDWMLAVPRCVREYVEPGHPGC